MEKVPGSISGGGFSYTQSLSAWKQWEVGLPSIPPLWTIPQRGSIEAMLQFLMWSSDMIPFPSDIIPAGQLQFCTHNFFGNFVSFEVSYIVAFPLGSEVESKHGKFISYYFSNRMNFCFQCGGVQRPTPQTHKLMYLQLCTSLQAIPPLTGRHGFVSRHFGSAEMDILDHLLFVDFQVDAVGDKVKGCVGVGFNDAVVEREVLVDEDLG